MLCTLIGLLSYAIHKHSCRSQHISVLTTCTFMFRQVCTIEPSFFNTTSGMHRRPLEGRHLVNYLFPFLSLKELTKGSSGRWFRENWQRSLAPGVALVSVGIKGVENISLTFFQQSEWGRRE